MTPDAIACENLCTVALPDVLGHSSNGGSPQMTVTYVSVSPATYQNFSAAVMLAVAFAS